MSDLVSRFAKYQDLHQSTMHAGVLHDLGWSKEGIPGSYIYFRTLGPFAIAKLQRPKEINLAWLNQFKKTHHTLTTYLEPGLTYESFTSIGIKAEPFAHSCTSLIDLLPSEKDILNKFSQKTRYNIVRTLKKDELKITSTNLDKLNTSQLSDFFTLHKNWSKQRNVIGYSKELLDATIKNYGSNGDLHLAYLGQDLVGALLILYHDSVSTYWAAFASSLGYKSFAPTLLTWTAIKHAKENGSEIFDFGGIFDPRYPKMYSRWIGFTKFKSGFNPTVISYPPTALQLFW